MLLLSDRLSYLNAGIDVDIEMQQLPKEDYPLILVVDDDLFNIKVIS